MFGVVFIGAGFMGKVLLRDVSEEQLGMEVSSFHWGHSLGSEEQLDLFFSFLVCESFSCWMGSPWFLEWKACLGRICHSDHALGGFFWTDLSNKRLEYWHNLLDGMA